MTIWLYRAMAIGQIATVLGLLGAYGAYQCVRLGLNMLRWGFT